MNTVVVLGTVHSPVFASIAEQAFLTRISFEPWEENKDTESI